MKSPTISVIVPVYNAEKTLRRCVDSILAQTFEDFELILINDGSKDQSGDICDEYAAKDPRVKTVHKTNGGVSSARNAGLRIAQGEYIAFIDSDDYILNNYFEELIKCDADAIICGFTTNGKSTVPSLSGKISKSKLPGIIDKDSKATYLKAPWGHLYRNKIIKEHTITFNDDIHWGEDYLFNLKFLKHATTIAFVSNSGYIYDMPTQIGKYKMPWDKYRLGLTVIEQELLDNSVTSYHKDGALDINRLWHFYTFRDYVSQLEKRDKTDALLNFLKTKSYKLLPKRGLFKRLKMIAELTRICISK